jgi:hypothetical protein
MKLRQNYHFYTFVLCLFLSISFTTSAKNCSKLLESACKGSKGACRWQSGTSCSGKFQSFCVADNKKCKAQSTCAKTAGKNPQYFKFQYNCLPSGLILANSKNCKCEIKVPPTPPKNGTNPGNVTQPGTGELFCAQLPYDACIINSAQCDSRTGTACGNLRYIFCRSAAVCNNTNTCAKEPASGLNYFFTEFCIPNGWTRLFDLSLCKCSATTTNQCPHCPPGYSCDKNGPPIPSNCISLSTVPILPPNSPPGSPEFQSS